MTKSLMRRVVRRLGTFFAGSAPARSSTAEWDQRARLYGARAVFNLAHDEHELEHVTDMQKRVIYPYVRAALRGDERLALDFGCGPGRFTGDLANMIGGRAIGVDTTRAFIDIAPRAERVEYRTMTAGHIPLKNGEIDLLWICLVLGGIVDDGMLKQSIAELDRVLRPGGLTVLVENTSDGRRTPHWRFRSVDDYQRLMKFVQLAHMGNYEDASERISIMIGRKGQAAGAAP